MSPEEMEIDFILRSNLERSAKWGSVVITRFMDTNKNCIHVRPSFP